MRKWGFLTSVLVCLLVFTCITLAQVTTGTISGTVSDSTGAVIPGTNITIRNVETGISRTVTSDARGRYQAPQLGLGGYEVTAEAPGFQGVVRSGITLTVGREAVVDFSMQVGAVAEKITVTGEAPLIETTSSTVAGLVDPGQMKDLPLNARSYEQLAFLQPNVYYQRNAILTTNTGYSPRISAAGMRTYYNSYVVDGMDVADTTNNTPGSVAGQLMGVETLREFRVITNNAPAQYGRSVGAVIDVTSRSGTNELHGTVFEFLRNDKVDARSFFDAGTPPYRRNQFGVVLGGPIVKDRAFFFGSYEALKDRQTSTIQVVVPTDEAKKGILPDLTSPTGTRTVIIPAAIKPYLALYPTPQVDIGGANGTYRFPFKGSTREDFVTGRVDYQHSDNVSYFARYNFDDADKILPRGLQVIPPWAAGLVSRNQTFTLAETRILSPTLINEFRAGFVRYTPRSRNVLTGPDPQIQFPGVIGAGIIQFTSTYASTAGLTVAALGSPGRAFEVQTGNTFQIADNLSYIRGPHSLKMGVNIERFHDNVGNYGESGRYQLTSTYTFQSLEEMLIGRARSFSGSLSPGANGISGRQLLYGLYMQDDYQVLPNFTLNLGLRYEWASNYSNVNSRFMILNDLWGTVKTGQKYAWGGRVCAGCLEPRFGFAWDIFSGGKTVLKGGFGMFHNQLTRFLAYYPITTSSSGGVSIAVDNPSFPDPRVPKAGSVIRITPGGSGASGATINPIVPSTPTTLQWNLTVEQQITPNMTVRLAYVGSHGYHLEGGTSVNPNTPIEVASDGTPRFPPTGLRRIRPDFGDITRNGYDFNSNYNSFTVTLGQRASRGIGFQTSYTISRNIDDVSSAGNYAAHVVSEPFLLDWRRHVHRGLSGLHMKHRFVGNVTYDFPSLASQNAFANKLFSGWQLNSIISVQAGTPVTPLIGFDRANSFAARPPNSQRPSFRPSLNGPVPICPCPNMPASLGGGTQSWPERYFDPTVFVLPERGTYGNVGRNIFTGPGLVNFDFALVKNTALTERLTLQFRAEAYNAFNNVNFGQPTAGTFQTSGAFNSSAGLIGNTVTQGRQFQLALKMLF